MRCWARRPPAGAYIASQRGEGWECILTRYDDGGCTGGNTERRALERCALGWFSVALRADARRAERVNCDRGSPNGTFILTVVTSPVTISRHIARRHVGDGKMGHSGLSSPREIEASMTSRERTLMALRHMEPDMVPVCLAYETPEAIAARYGKGPDEIEMRQDIYAVTLRQPPPHGDIKERYLADVPPDASIDAWGVARWWSSTSQSHAVVGPLKGMTTVEELDEFPFPDVGSDEYAVEAAQEVRAHHEQGFAVQGAMSQTIFELAWAMHGMENLMVAFYDNPEFVNRLFDEITARRQAMARQLVKAGVDVLRLGDDVGCQRGMMMHPEIWRAFLKPRLASIIELARKDRPGIPVFYHSDGDVREIIGDLIEIGVTILNPVQPECMDPFEIKKQYGDRLTLWGTIGTQTVFPFGTPEQMRQLVKEYMEALAPGGGYVIGPTHSLNDDVPWENIAAFYEAVERFGVYGSNG